MFQPSTLLKTKFILLKFLANVTSVRHRWKLSKKESINFWVKKHSHCLLQSEFLLSCFPKFRLINALAKHVWFFEQNFRIEMSVYSLFRSEIPLHLLWTAKNKHSLKHQLHRSLLSSLCLQTTIIHEQGSKMSQKSHQENSRKMEFFMRRETVN